MNEYINEALAAFKSAVGEVKMATARRRTDVAKTASADAYPAILSMVGEVESDAIVEKAMAFGENLSAYVDGELRRIKSLPQAPRAFITEMPAGIHAVDREFAINKPTSQDLYNEKLKEAAMGRKLQ